MDDRSEHLIEIYFADLRPAKQRELLRAAGLRAPEEANWNAFPLTYFSVGEDSGRKDDED